MTVYIDNISAYEAKRIIRGPIRKSLSQMELKIMDSCLGRSSVLWTGRVDEDIACIWGVVPPTLLSNKAYLWLYTTDIVKEHTFLLIRHSQIAIRKMLEDYDTLYGHCLRNSKKTHKWLEWLGAKFETTQDDLVFFSIRRH